jgi:ubiquinone/menaquinone biosynthesis C-methylase UbiE
MQTDSNYDEFATVYNEDNERNAYNALYERPAALALAGSVAGLRVLDAGCGAGAHAAALIAAGAKVAGIDKSQALLAIARERLGPEVSLINADLQAPLGFEDGSFDIVLASLVMHYMRDWQPVLTEFNRILAPGGRLVNPRITLSWITWRPGERITLKPTSSPISGRRAGERSISSTGTGPSTL